MIQLDEIRQRLKDASTPKALAAYQRLIPTAEKLYGVSTPAINELAKEFGPGGIPLARDLWASGAYEERLLATKILGRAARKSPAETWSTAREFAEDLSDWATCDTLGMEGIRGLLPKLQNEVFASALEYCGREGEWQRRFGLVLLTHFAGDPDRRAPLLATINSCADDRRHYVKKALEWLRKDLQKADVKSSATGKPL